MATLNLNTRYLNTASISSGNIEKADLSFVSNNNSIIRCGDGNLALPAGVSLFFSPNATQCILAFVEFRFFRCNFALDLANKESVHPILYKALGALRTSSAQGFIRLETLEHWITGEFFSDILYSTKNLNVSDSPLVIDAVQAFGCLSENETQAIFKLVSGGAVVVGCLHKWLGCAAPLGFALVPTFLLEKDPALQQHLAIRDYLGPSIGDRPGFETFPDTYSASLAPLFIQSLRMALGNDPDASENLRKIIEFNRNFICSSIHKSRAFCMAPAGRACRGMVAASAPTEEAANISRILFENGFAHTIFQDWPIAGTSTLRLSAPLVEMDAESRDLFQTILSV